MAKKTSLFISYSRTDHTFTERLYRDLKALEYSIWWDRQSMLSRGFTFFEEIQNAIVEADRFILLVSRKSMESPYVLQEWDFALSICKPIIPLLLEDDYSMLPAELGVFHVTDFRQTRPYEDAFEDLMRHLNEDIPPLAPLYGVPRLPEHYVARPDDLSHLSNYLFAEINKATVITSIKQTTTLQGMGGIGKTIVAAAFARSCVVRRTFHDGVFWVTVGREETSPRVLLEQVGKNLGDSPQYYTDIATARQRLQSLFASKRYLIILDDVWETSSVEPFQDIIAQTRCRLLITTRSSQVSQLLGANEHPIQLLTSAQAVDMLRKRSDKDDPYFETIARELGYLPLALVLAAAQIQQHMTGEEWLLRFDSISRIRTGRKAKNSQESLIISIDLSVDNVFGDEPFDKLLYYTFGIFREDVSIPQDVVIRLWRHIRPDLPQFDCEEILNELVSLALVWRDTQKTITLHDLLHDYTREQLGSRCVQTHIDLLASYNDMGKPWYEIPHDGYLYKELAYHLLEADRAGTLIALLTESSAWLEASFVSTIGYTAYAADVKLAMTYLSTVTDKRKVQTLILLRMCQEVINTRVSVYQDLDLETLVYLNRADEALTHVRLRTTLEGRVAGLLVVARFLNVGENVKIILDEAYEIALRVPSGAQQEQALLSVAIAYASNNELANIYEILTRVQQKATWQTILHQVVLALIDVQLFDALETFIQNYLVNDIDILPRVLRDAVPKLVKLGAYSQAQDFIDQITDIKWRIDTILSALSVASDSDKADSYVRQLVALTQSTTEDIDATIALGLVDLGYPIQAFEIVKNMRHQYWLEEPTIALMGFFAQQGQLSDAIDLIERLSTWFAKQSALINLTAELQAMGNTSAITEIRNRYNDLDSMSATIRNKTLLAMAHLNDIETLLERYSLALDEEVGVSIIEIISHLYPNEALHISTIIQNNALLHQVALLFAKDGHSWHTLEVLKRLSIEQVDMAVLEAVAEYFAKYREFDAALSLEHIWQQARLPVSTQANIRRYVARGMAIDIDPKAGNMLEEALGLAQGTENPTKLSETLQKVSEVFAHKGQAVVRKLVDHIPDAVQREHASESIVTTLIDTQQPHLALDLALSIRRSEARSRSLLSAIQALTAASKMEVAVDSIRHIPAYDLRDEALKICAIAFANEGNAEAIQIARGIRSIPQRTNTLYEIVERLIENAAFDTALLTLRFIPSSDTQATLCSKISIAIAKSGDFQRALEVAYTITVDVSRENTLSKIAEQVALENRIAESKRILLSLSIQKLGHFLSSQRQFAGLKMLLDQTQDDELRVQLVQVIAELYARNGNREQAIAFVKEQAPAQKQAICTRTIANGLARGGYFQAAETLASSIADTEIQALGFTDIILELVQQGQILTAVQLASRIPLAEYQDVAIEQLVQLALSNNFSLLVEAIAALAYPEQRAKAWTIMAQCITPATNLALADWDNAQIRFIPYEMLDTWLEAQFWLPIIRLMADNAYAFVAKVLEVLLAQGHWQDSLMLIQRSQSHSDLPTITLMATAREMLTKYGYDLIARRVQDWISANAGSRYKTRTPASNQFVAQSIIQEFDADYQPPQWLTPVSDWQPIREKTWINQFTKRTVLSTDEAFAQSPFDTWTTIDSEWADPVAPDGWFEVDSQSGSEDFPSFQASEPSMPIASSTTPKPPQLLLDDLLTNDYFVGLQITGLNQYLLFAADLAETLEYLLNKTRANVRKQQTPDG